MNKAEIDIGTTFFSITALPDGIPAPIRVKTADSVFGDNFSMPTVAYAERGGGLKYLGIIETYISPRSRRSDMIFP